MTLASSGKHALPRARKSARRPKKASSVSLRDVMTTPVLTLTTAQPASDALAEMLDAGVRHAVVLLGADIVGVISDRDLGGTDGGLVRLRRTVGELMHADAVVVKPDMSLGDAVHLVRERRIGCLPVVDHHRLVGIVTRSDLLRVLDAGAENARRMARHEPSDERPPTLVSPNRDKWP
ncbi:CBS domain protein AcuB [Labilithrix luteola]|uniref:CBS domain protein AcuB n=1 Tax=Labilithrix luteola TaxID=1391654 RepID=A0A0K1Q453_9BACT|nr:CBS domain-containing protein [Labilithrix luteola]AKV00611.1 CBS domain protein AcuB [Labilithrix luteola]